MVPDELFQLFLRTCSQQLMSVECVMAAILDDAPQPVAILRQCLLQQQRECLEQVLRDWNKENNSVAPVSGDQMQTGLRALQLSSRTDIASLTSSNPSTTATRLRADLDAMNEAARWAFCRLLLYSETMREKQKELRNTKQARDFENDEESTTWMMRPMQRSDIFEFCGLCKTVVRLPEVQRHLRDGSALFSVNNKNCGSHSTAESSPTAAATTTPQNRLDLIQRRFLRALGYDPDHGTTEIQRIFFTPQPNEYSNDAELIETFSQLVCTMNSVLVNETLHAQQKSFFSGYSNDTVDGGVSRIVSVTYSEKLVDVASGQDVVDQEKNENTSFKNAISPPSVERMDQQVHAQQQASLKIARDAAALEQEILGELLSLRDGDRHERLVQAKEAADDFRQKALEIPMGTERVAFLRSVDPRTQRLLLMHKIWEGVVASNGGKEPVIHFQSQT
jgi:hypothetical protein